MLHDIISARRPENKYKQSLLRLYDNVRDHPKANHEKAMYAVLEIRWGKPFAHAIENAINIHKSHPNASYRGVSPDNSEAIAELLHDFPSRFAVDKVTIQFETTLLIKIANRAARGEHVPEVAKYVFAQLYEAFSGEFELASESHTPKVTQTGDGYLADDEAFDKFVELISSMPYGDYVKNEIDAMRTERKNDAVGHILIMRALSPRTAGEIEAAWRDPGGPGPDR